MAIVMMGKQFEAPPSKDEILGLVTDQGGDRSKAKAALTKTLAPMKDLLALYQYIDEIDKSADKVAALASERQKVEAELADLKAKTATAKKANDAQVDRGTKLADEISNLEKTKADLAKEITDEQTARVRMNENLSREYDALRKEMYAKIAKEEDDATFRLKAINAAVDAAQRTLDEMAEKKRAFIASLGG